MQKTVQDHVEETVKDASCIVVTTDHVELRKLRIPDLLEKAGNLKAVIDARHIFDPNEVREAGLVYRGLGRGRHSRV